MPKSIKKDFYLPAIIGFALYVFNATNLWVNGNLYFSDMLAQPFFIAIVYTFLLYINTDTEKTRKIYFSLLIFFSFLIVYTEWIGVFVLFICFIVSIFFVKKNKNIIYLMFLMPVAGIMAIVLTAYQYSLVDGWDSFSTFIIEKYQQRSGATDLAQGNFTLKNPVAHDALKNYFVDGFLPLLWGIVITSFIAAIVFILSYKKTAKFNLNGFLVLVLSILPVLLHILFLFNFNSWHNFSVHKSSFPFVIIISFLLVFIFANTEKIQLFYHRVVLILFSLGSFVVSYFGYKDYVKQVNPTYNYKINKLVGDAIQKYANPDDAIFTDVPSSPELMFYSKRNPFNTSSIEESLEYMKGLDNANEALFIGRYGQELGSISRFNTKGESTLLWKRTD